MIKNILVTLISVFCLIVNANANIKISSDVVDNSIKETFIGEQNQASALATWKENIENDGSISALAVWRVCWAGGLDIKNKSEDKNKCQIFRQNLLKDSSLKYRTTCQKNAGEGTYCIDDFFTNSFYGGTQVGLSDAIMLAKEWARINHADDSLECDDKVITVKPKNILARASDDYAILCASKNRKTYYEFVFDHIGESDSGAIFNSVGAATCKLFNTKANVPTLACIARTPEHIENTNGNCQPVSCDSDANICGKINSTLAKFGYTGVYKNNKCEIFFNNVSDKKGLKTAFGINSFEFCKGIKVQNTPSVEALLKQHIVKNAKVDISDVSCSPGHRIYKGPGCSDDGKDDIKTCYAQGQQIDFVFDDINTFIKEYHQGGIQGMECVISGGTFSGQHCAHLNQEQCDALAKSDVSRCSVCRDIEWDKENNICKLKNAENANDLEKTINIAQLAAATTAAVFTGGIIAFTAVKVGTVAFTVPVLLTLVNVTGQIMEFVGTLEAKGIAKEFIVQSNNCNDSNCADLLVKDWLQRLSNLRNELTKAEYNGINEELARLLKMTSKKFKENMAMNILIEYSRGANKGDISANVQKKFQELYESPDLLESNKKGFFDKDSWEPEQVLRAVGIGLQIASTIGSAVYSWHQENKALAATRDALNEGYDGITHDPAKREAVKKQLANANIVDAGSIKASGETATSKQLIGQFDELLMPSTNIDDFAETLQKEGYIIERYEKVHPFNEKSKVRAFRIYANAGSSGGDIQTLQYEFMKKATDADKNARLASSGNIYWPLATSDSPAVRYKEMVVEALKNDPEVKEAFENWEKMTARQKYEFEDRTNRKIRRLISGENKPPVSYVRVENPATDGASYLPQRIGKDAKSVVDFDEYSLNQYKEFTFRETLDNRIHENYHNFQDLGKSDISKDILDYNLDNYVRPDGTVFRGEYQLQHLERGVKGIAEEATKDIISDFYARKFDDLREAGKIWQKSDDARIKELGESVTDFFNTKTNENYNKLRRSVSNVKYGSMTNKDIVNYIKSYDMQFWDALHDMIE